MENMSDQVPAAMAGSWETVAEYDSEHSRDGNDSDLLDCMLMDNSKYRVQVELLRACLAEAELERDAARRQTSPPRRKDDAGSARKYWFTLSVIALVFAVTGANGVALVHQRRETAAQARAAEHLRGQLEDEREQRALFLVKYATLTEQHAVCQRGLELQVSKGSGALGPMLLSSVFGPLQVVMQVAEFARHAGRRIFRHRSTEKLSVTSG